MHVVDAERAAQVFDYRPLIESLREQHRLPPASLDDMYLTEGSNGILIRGAWQPGAAVGVKLATIFPANSDLPSVQAVYVLFDGSDGRPTAVIDGTWLTWFKTACDSGLGADYLAPAAASRLLMVGAGAMAPHLIEAHLSVRPEIQRVEIWNRTPERAAVLADSLDLGVVDVAAVTDLETAVRSADVVSVATMSPEPLIAGEWLGPGTHVDLVGAYTPAMREADDEVMIRADIYVDSRATTVAEIGELMDPIAEGVISEADVLGDLYQLAQGTVRARESDDAITVYKNGGGGHLDLMTAQFVMSRLQP
jgi:ornithine cyclodeaminase